MRRLHLVAFSPRPPSRPAHSSTTAQRAFLLRFEEQSHKIGRQSLHTLARVLFVFERAEFRQQTLSHCTKFSKHQLTIK